MTTTAPTTPVSAREEVANFQELGLTASEYELIVERLGRHPNFTELSIFSVMWSEHCSYKSSRHLLKTLPTEAPHVLQGPGENAGVIDAGDGWAIAFKVESHNHPSAIEPFHGAATGVGGILRDVFTMGARPVALLNSLRFGPLAGATQAAARTRHLLEGVVSGIAAYGNCVGVPTVGGEVVFDESYTRNPLVNAMCVGLMRHEQLQLGGAHGVGNPVVYVGARTGRDGIHGATFASVEDPHDRERSAVQVGDPFMEKLLIEACLELLATGAVVGMQDMGAAGLTSSSVEMAARAGSGIRLDLDRVPRRESGMTPVELMLSESQERMLVVMEQGRESLAHDILEKWGLEATVIGEVTNDGMIALHAEGERVALLPLDALVEDAPQSIRPAERPAWLAAMNDLDLTSLADIAPNEAAQTLTRLLASPTIASKAWIHRQYDSMVGAATVVRPGSDAAVVAIRDTDLAIAASMDCNGRWCLLNPHRGAAHAVAEAARNVACSGARPLAVTNCLNFSTPEDPAIAWQLAEAVAGMGDACRTLGTPVVSGNVSLYNRSGDVDIQPTPVVGVVGVIDHPRHVTTQAWKQENSRVMLLCDQVGGQLGGSELLATVHGRIAGDAPPLDLKHERALQELLLEQIRLGRVRSAHDVSDGGLLVALAECAIGGGIGAQLELPGRDQAGRLDELLFGEGNSRIVVEVAPEDVADIAVAAGEAGLRCVELGTTGGTRFHCSDILDLDLHSLEDAWSSALPTLMTSDERRDTTE